MEHIERDRLEEFLNTEVPDISNKKIWIWGQEILHICIRKDCGDWTGKGCPLRDT